MNTGKFKKDYIERKIYWQIEKLEKEIELEREERVKAISDYFRKKLIFSKILSREEALKEVNNHYTFSTGYFQEISINRLKTLLSMVKNDNCTEITIDEETYRQYFY